MKKYQVGIEFKPDGDVKSTKGLIDGKSINNIRKLVKLNPKRDTYLHIWFNEKEEIIEISKLSKKEYDNLRCGWGLTDFGDFAKKVGLI